MSIKIYEVEPDEFRDIVQRNQELIQYVALAVDTEGTGPFTNKVCRVEYTLSLGPIVIESEELIEADDFLKTLATIQDMTYDILLVGEDGKYKIDKGVFNKLVEAITALFEGRRIKGKSDLFKLIASMEKAIDDPEEMDKLVKQLRMKIISMSTDYREKLISDIESSFEVKDKPTIKLRMKRKKPKHVHK